MQSESKETDDLIYYYQKASEVEKDICSDHKIDPEETTEELKKELLTEFGIKRNIINSLPVIPSRRYTLFQMFYDMTLTIKKRSEDASTQVGCMIINDQGKILSYGYNAYTKAMDSQQYQTIKDSDVLDNFTQKHHPSLEKTKGTPINPISQKTSNYNVIMQCCLDKSNVIQTMDEKRIESQDLRPECMVHSEINALAHSSVNLSNEKNLILFVTLLPCENCMKVICQFDFKAIIYFADRGKYFNTWSMALQKDILMIRADLLGSIVGLNLPIKENFEDCVTLETFFKDPDEQDINKKYHGVFIDDDRIINLMKRNPNLIKKTIFSSKTLKTEFKKDIIYHHLTITYNIHKIKEILRSLRC
jgi:deoxycytidylate deaminase